MLITLNCIQIMYQHYVRFIIKLVYLLKKLYIRLNFPFM